MPTTGGSSEDQRGRQQGAGVASLYVGDFHGGQRRHSSAKQTLEFFGAAQRFINREVADPENQLRYQVDLLSGIRCNALDIQPSAFSLSHVDLVDQQGFKATPTDARLDPRLPITNDSLRLKASRLRVDYQHGIYLVGSPSASEQRVHLLKKDNNDQSTRVDDPIRRLAGR